MKASVLRQGSLGPCITPRTEGQDRDATGPGSRKYTSKSLADVWSLRLTISGRTCAGRPPLLPGKHRDRLDLHQAFRDRKALDDHQRAGRAGRPQILIAWAGDQRPVGDVRDVLRDLHDVVQRPAEVLHDRLEVPVALLGLGLRVALPDEIALRVQTELPRDVERVPNPGDVRVVRLGRMHARWIDALASWHQTPPL